MKNRTIVLITLLLMCALISSQKAVAALSAEIVGDKSVIANETRATNITFTVRVTSEAGDSYSARPSSIGLGQQREVLNQYDLIETRQTEITTVTANPASFTINGAGTQDITFTIPRTSIPDDNDSYPDNVEFFFGLFDATDVNATDPFFDVDDPVFTVYLRLPGQFVVDLKFGPSQKGGDTQDFSPDQIKDRDVTFTLAVESLTSDPANVTFSVSSIRRGSEIIDAPVISFSNDSVIVPPNAVERVIVTIHRSLFTKVGSYRIRVVATPAGSVGKATTLTINIGAGAGLLLDGLNALTRTSTTDDAEDITYTLRLTNTGTSSDGINFAISGDVGTATINLNRIVLFPDSFEDITLTIPRAALSAAGTYNVAVTATSENDPTVTTTLTTKTTVTGDTVPGDTSTPINPTNPIEPTGPDVSTHQVVLSEFMFEAGGGETDLPQWIEVYNNSSSVVNLSGWKLHWKSLKPSLLELTFTFDGDFRIPPQQARLIVTAVGRHSGGGNLSDDDVYQLPLLNITGSGFSLKLTNPTDVLVDHIGTLNGDKNTWELPLTLIEGFRSSLIRRFDAGVPRSGIEKRAWRRAFDAKRLVKGIYYGNPRDLGTPGYRRGKPLPVELSQFSAKFVKNEVVINWTTESEIDNAGFNIFRSTSRAKNFHRINTKLIGSAGTTGQRTQYQFIDKTAKPDVAYYYRLEDLDLAGTRGILTTYRLRGVIAPTGKHITKWGTLKDNR